MIRVGHQRWDQISTWHGTAARDGCAFARGFLSRRADSNCRPAVYETAALPAELRRLGTPLNKFTCSGGWRRRRERSDTSAERREKPKGSSVTRGIDLLRPQAAVFVR